MKKRNYYGIDAALILMKADGFRYWVDEFSVCRDIETFITIFYAKYAPRQNDFTFWFDKIKGNMFLIAESISKFQYWFPLQK